MRISRAAVTAASVAVLAGVVPASVATSQAAHAAATPDTAAPKLKTPVTLITGDTVTTATGSDGKPTIGFKAAPRSDGTPVTYTAFGDADGHYYVVPSDVASMFGTKLDKRLFDVNGLEKLQKGKADTTPVIAQAATNARTRSVAKPDWKDLGVTKDRTLESIDAVSGDVSKNGAPDLVDAVESGKTVSKVWLDAPTKTTDADSDAQIGATQAWESGDDGTGVTVAVLDTGIDTTHPDLDNGLVTLQKDFTGGDDPVDHFGHGSHVASIIAGSGEASDGQYKGVAPGVHIISGKVIGNDGTGDESWAIDAMEWAAQNGAEVINMSLGVQGAYTDGTDPGALAVDSISERYPNTLVVIAAGNEGNWGAPFTVTTPGTADAALTVGSVGRGDVTSYFSSRGPRYGDYAIKPDIVAPGEDIVAARAAGTSEGYPVDDNYTSMSGTSMATPHVVGAAAILKQAHPELTGQQLKSVLMGSAQAVGNTVFDEGSGRVWIPGALDESVFATPASLSFGHFDQLRKDQQPKTKTVTYTNDSDADVTVNLDYSLKNATGATVPADEVTLSASTLTIPAHGTASVDVTVNPTAGDPNVFAGVLNATGDGFPTVRTVMAFQVDPDEYMLHLSATRRGGQPAGERDTGWIYSVEDPSISQWFSFTDGKADVRLPAGHYAVVGQLWNAVSPQAAYYSGATNFTRDADLTSGDATITLNGDTGIPVKVDTEKKTSTYSYDSTLARTLPNRSWPVMTDVVGTTDDYGSDVDLNLYYLPTPDSLAGTVTVTNRFLESQPLLDVAAVGKGKPLDVSTDLDYASRSPRYTGRLDARIVDGGTGSAADLANVNAKGAVVMIEESAPDTGNVNDPTDLSFNFRANAAKAAGAAALVVYGATDGPFIQYVDSWTINNMTDQPLPTLTLSRATALKVLDAAKKGARLEGTGRSTPTYQYALGYTKTGTKVPSQLTFSATTRNTAAVETEVRAFKPFGTGNRTPESFYIMSDGSMVGWQYNWPAAVSGRTVYYSTEPGVTFQHNVAAAIGPEAYPAWFYGKPVTYKVGKQPKETYNAAVFHGGLWPTPETPQQASVYREGDNLGINLPERVDGTGIGQSWGRDQDSTGLFEVWAGDTQLTSDEWGTYYSGSVAAGSTRYKIRNSTQRSNAWWPESTSVTTEWGFSSKTTSAATVLPLLQLDYGVQGLDAYNQAGRSTSLNLSVSHQDGSTSHAAITELKLWSSVDGTHWTPVRVSSVHGKSGAYAATIATPKGAKSISLRSEAKDSAGATFNETVVDAYSVK